MDIEFWSLFQIDYFTFFILFVYRFWSNLFDSQKWWYRRPKNICNENNQTRFGCFSRRTAVNLPQ